MYQPSARVHALVAPLLAARRLGGQPVTSLRPVTITSLSPSRRRRRPRFAAEPRRPNRVGHKTNVDILVSITFHVSLTVPACPAIPPVEVCHHSPHPAWFPYSTRDVNPFLPFTQALVTPPHVAPWSCTHLSPRFPSSLASTTVAQHMTGHKPAVSSRRRVRRGQLSWLSLRPSTDGMMLCHEQFIYLLYHPPWQAELGGSVHIPPQPLPTFSYWLEKQLLHVVQMEVESTRLNDGRRGAAELWWGLEGVHERTRIRASRQCHHRRSRSAAGQCCS